MNTDFSTLIISILFILPGFIIISVMNLFKYNKKVKTFDKTLQSIIATILFWFFIYLIATAFELTNIFNKLQNIRNNGNFRILDFISLTPYFLVIYIFAFVIGLIIGSNFHKFRKEYNSIYKKIFGQTPYKHVWEEIFEEIMINGKNKIVFIKTINGDMFFGGIDIVSFNSDDRAICLSSLRRYDKYNDEILEEALSNINKDSSINDRFYIKYDSIEYLIIFPKIRNMDTDLFAKKLEKEKISFMKKLFEKIKNLFGK